MVALVGMATAYSESTLAQLYKITTKDGQYRGGPAFYMAKGLNAPWAGSIFSVCLILAFGLVFVAVQSNSIAEAFSGATGLPKFGVGRRGGGPRRHGDLRRNPVDRQGRRAARPDHGGRVSPYGRDRDAAEHHRGSGDALADRIERFRPQRGGRRHRRRDGRGSAQRRQARALLERGGHGFGAQHRRRRDAAAASSRRARAWSRRSAASSTRSSSARRPR